jgi:hypothetical protein
MKFNGICLQNSKYMMIILYIQRREEQGDLFQYTEQVDLLQYQK